MLRRTMAATSLLLPEARGDSRYSRSLESPTIEVWNDPAMCHWAQDIRSKLPIGCNSAPQCASRLNHSPWLNDVPRAESRSERAGSWTIARLGILRRELWKSSGRCAQRRYVYDGAGRLACGRAAERFDANGYLARERQRLLLHQGQSAARCACGGEDAEGHGSCALRQRPEFIVRSRRTRGKLCGARHEAIRVAEHLQFPDMFSGLGGDGCHSRGPIGRKAAPVQQRRQADHEHYARRQGERPDPAQCGLSGREVQSPLDGRPDMLRRLYRREAFGQVHETLLPEAAALIDEWRARAPALEAAAGRTSQSSQCILGGETIDDLGVVRFHVTTRDTAADCVIRGGSNSSPFRADCP